MLPLVTEETVNLFLGTDRPDVVADIVAMSDSNPVLGGFLATYIEEASVEGLDPSHPDVVETGAFVEGFLACFGLLASQAEKDLVGSEWDPYENESGYDGNF